MIKKFCETCHEYSYSSAERQWICPTCGRDLTDTEPEQLTYNERVGSCGQWENS